MLAAIEEKVRVQVRPVRRKGRLRMMCTATMWGVHRQKQGGLSYVGATVLNGRLNPEQLHALAALAETHGDGHLRATIGQNIVLVNIPNAKTQEVVREITALGLQVEPTVFYRGAWRVRDGDFASWRSLRRRALRSGLWASWRSGCRSSTSSYGLHVTGCTNSCGQSWIATLGSRARS